MSSALGDKTTTRKSDKLPPVGEANVARQVLRVSTVKPGAGNREVVRVRPFVRVATNLSLSTSELSANIPPFNPQRMLADRATGSANDDAAAGRRARRRSVLRHPRPRRRAAARADGRHGADR